MKKNVEYIIPYEGLKIGKHEFLFQLDDAFFEDRGFTDIRNVKIEMKVSMIKDITMLVFEFEHTGTAEVDCDRCLDTYTQPVNGQNKLIVSFGDEYNDEDETVIVLPRTESEIDLAPFIYEYTTLSIPWKKECRLDISGTKTCNAAMIEKIDALQAGHETKAESDPRWDALKKLK